MNRRFQFSLRDVMIAPAFLGGGFWCMLHSTSPSSAYFAVLSTGAGACFGAGIGVFIKHPVKLAAYGAGAWFFFAVYAGLL